jgi:hypothetical protein
MAHGDAREGKWRGNLRMEWLASTRHTTSEHGVSSITTADAHTSTARSRLNWRPRRFKWTRPFRRKTKSGFCACAIAFQLASTSNCNNGTNSFLFLFITTATHLTDEGWIWLRFSWLAVTCTTALTSAHENMVAYTIMSECRANSLLREASGTSAIGWLPQPSARFSGQIGIVWRFWQHVECRFNL